MSKHSIDWEHIHKEMGCNECRYCDMAALFKSPCCTYAFKLEVDHKTGECLTRKEEE